MARQLLNTNQEDSDTSTYRSYPKDDIKKSLSNDDFNTSDSDKPKADIQVSAPCYFQPYNFIFILKTLC